MPKAEVGKGKEKEGGEGGGRRQRTILTSSAQLRHVQRYRDGKP